MQRFPVILPSGSVVFYCSEEAAESVVHLYGGSRLSVGVPSDGDAPAKPSKAKSATKKVAALATASQEDDPPATIDS